eukprot:7003510-Karenia_brevis.AAC.1
MRSLIGITSTDHLPLLSVVNMGVAKDVIYGSRDSFQIARVPVRSTILGTGFLQQCQGDRPAAIDLARKKFGDTFEQVGGGCIRGDKTK